MTYLALYRKYRPQSFRDVVGQEHITRTLGNALLENRLSHAYLFTGPRGTGKTTVARLLAKAVNCLSRGGSAEPCNECDSCVGVTDGSDLDVLEIDAASNRGIDEIRDLRDKVRYSPARSAKKVYIIDEVHMLTNEAFNALLKTIEDPPEHCIFIFATTDPQRIPATILSRCQRFDFHNIGPSSMLDRLEEVCRREGIEADPEALMLIVRHARGGMRDALGLLDQARSLAGDSPIERDLLLDVLGTADEETLLELTEHALEGNIGPGLQLLARIIDEGRDPRQLMKDWIGYLRNLLVVASAGAREAQQLLVVGDAMMARMEAQASRAGFGRLLEAIEYLSERDSIIRWAPDPRIAFEAAWLRFHSAALPTDAGVSSAGPGAAQPVQPRSQASGSGSGTALRDKRGSVGTGDPGLGRAHESRIRTASAEAPAATEQTAAAGRAQTGVTTDAQTAPAADAQTAAATEIDLRDEAGADPKGGAAGVPDKSAPPREPGELTTEYIKSNWPRVLAEADPQMKFYLQGLDPLDLRGDSLIIRAGNKFLKDRMSDTKYRSRFEDLLARLFGQRLRIRWSDSAGGDEGSAGRGDRAADAVPPAPSQDSIPPPPEEESRPGGHDSQHSSRQSSRGGREDMIGFEPPPPPESLPEPPPEPEYPLGEPPPAPNDSYRRAQPPAASSASAPERADGMTGEAELDTDDLLTEALTLFKARFVEPGPVVAKQWDSSSSSGGAQQ